MWEGQGEKGRDRGERGERGGEKAAGILYLTQVHDNALMHLLPEVGPKYLDEGDLQGRDLAMHEDASQVQLHLKPHIHLVEQEVEGAG